MDARYYVTFEKFLKDGDDDFNTVSQAIMQS